jgi:hypothetical protein
MLSTSFFYPSYALLPPETVRRRIQKPPTGSRFLMPYAPPAPTTPWAGVGPFDRLAGAIGFSSADLHRALTR